MTTLWLTIAFLALLLGAIASSAMFNIAYAETYPHMEKNLRILAWIFPLAYNVIAWVVLYRASLYDRREGPPPSIPDSWSVGKVRLLYRQIVVLYLVFNISIEYISVPTMEHSFVILWAFAAGIFLVASLALANIYLRSEVYGDGEMPPYALLLEAFQFLVTVFAIVMIAGKPSRNVKKQMDPILLILRWYLVWLKPVFYCAIQYGLLRKPATDVLRQVVIHMLPPPVDAAAELQRFPFVNFYAQQSSELTRQPSNID